MELAVSAHPPHAPVATPAKVQARLAPQLVQALGSRCLRRREAERFAGRLSFLAVAVSGPFARSRMRTLFAHVYSASSLVSEKLEADLMTLNAFNAMRYVGPFRTEVTEKINQLSEVLDTIE